VDGREEVSDQDCTDLQLLTLLLTGTSLERFGLSP